VADTAKLSEETGWTAKVDWREGLQDLADWLRANRPGLSQPEPQRIRA
jgi:CDP-paratose 2-epimerase